MISPAPIRHDQPCRFATTSPAPIRDDQLTDSGRARRGVMGRLRWVRHLSSAAASRHRQVSASSRFLRALTYASPPAFRHTDMPCPCRLASAISQRATSAPCLSHSSVILVALLRSLPARRGVMGRLRWMRHLSSAAASRRFRIDRFRLHRGLYARSPT
jgi:hypothetical protein